MLTAASAVAPHDGPVVRPNYALQIGGWFSLAFALLQLTGIWWPTSAVKYMGGPAEMKAQHPLQYAALCVALALAVALFGLYALSGAGKIRALPLLRTGMVTISAIYLVRGLLAIPQAPFILEHPNLSRFLVFSLISLGVGAIHAWGTVQLFRHGRLQE
jgi:hypothetical protein